MIDALLESRMTEEEIKVLNQVEQEASINKIRCQTELQSSSKQTERCVINLYLSSEQFTLFNPSDQAPLKSKEGGYRRIIVDENGGM